MDKHKEVFFVIRLHPIQVANTLGPIADPDALINCDLMDGRDAFLTLAREKHYEFSSLRRAKFSSVALLFELHNSKYSHEKYIRDQLSNMTINFFYFFFLLTCLHRYQRWLCIHLQQV